MATTIVKDKNLIYLSGGNFKYVLDLNAKTLHKVGLKRELKTTQTLVTNLSGTLCGDFVTAYPKTCEQIRSGLSWRIDINYWVKSIQKVNILEQIFKQCNKDYSGVRLGYTHYVDRILEDKKALSYFTKKIQEQTKLEWNALEVIWREYVRMPYADLLEKYNTSYDELSNQVRGYMDNKYPIEQMDFILYCDKVLHAFEFLGYGTIKKYLEQCKYLDKKPIKTHSLITEMHKTKVEWDIKKDEMADKKVFEHQTKNKSKVFFENDKYITIIPTSVKELKTEAERQGNCLASYIYDVAEGNTTIVFVRDKAKVEKNLVTCEIRDGKIRQYLLQHNRSVREEQYPDLFAFRMAYINHLNNIK